MKTLTLDIETVNPYSVNGEFGSSWDHVPIVISWLEKSPDQRDIVVTYSDLCRGERMHGCLEHLCGRLNACDHLITWNGRSFDVPLLALYADKHGVDLRFLRGEQGKRYPYRSDLRRFFHHDVCDYLRIYGATMPPKLNTIARILELPTKDDHGCSGDQVAGLWASGPDGKTKVIEYCKFDVKTTHEIWLKVMAD